eukprot:2853132-Prymnesium_polylepis.1
MGNPEAMQAAMAQAQEAMGSNPEMMAKMAEAADALRDPEKMQAAMAEGMKKMADNPEILETLSNMMGGGANPEVAEMLSNPEKMQARRPPAAAARAHLRPAAVSTCA